MITIIPIIFLALENIYFRVYFKKFSIGFFFVSWVIPVLFFVFYQHWPFLQYIALSVLFIGIFRAGLSDFRSREVDLSHVIEIGAGVVLYRILSGNQWLEGLISALIIFAVLFAAYLLTKKRGIGFGDILVFSILAGAVHPAGVFVLLLLSSLSGLIYAWIRITLFKQKGEMIPWVPFVGTGLFVYLLLEKAILELFLIIV